MWSRETNDRIGVDHVFIAGQPEEKESLFSSTIGSDVLEKRFSENMDGKIKEISFLKKKNDKDLQIIWFNGEPLSLKENNFVLLFISKENISEKEFYDSFLIFNFPQRLKSGIFHKYFPKDQKENIAMHLFWMLKDLV